jgi:hypothetical protein
MQPLRVTPGLGIAYSRRSVPFSSTWGITRTRARGVRRTLRHRRTSRGFGSGGASRLRHAAGDAAGAVPCRRRQAVAEHGLPGRVHTASFGIFWNRLTKTLSDRYLVLE